LLRLYAYTNQQAYREKAEQTMDVAAGLAGKFGIFAATYGIASVHFSQPHSQTVIIGEDDLADQLYAVATSFFGLTQSVLRLPLNEVTAQNLPPGLAETIPNLPGIGKGESMAVVCSGFTCQPPISDPEELRHLLGHAFTLGA